MSATGGEQRMSLEKNPTTGQILEHLGPTIEFLTEPQDAQNDFCVLKGIIPPGVILPLHSHPDTEDFLVTEGEIEVLKQDERGYAWITVHTGDYVHTPVNARHAWRNVSRLPATCLIITTRRLAQFFQETGRSLTDALHPPTPQELARIADGAARYDYWLATPEENAAVGIHVNV
jgi:quercetin dioxygenase-like cupin family protein